MPQLPSLLRRRDGHHARVTFEELFFDLVYVFAVTQLSHLLLHHLGWMGVAETTVLWFAVWLGWQYTCWLTNWFDPETPHIRALLFLSMLAGLVMAASIPRAFGDAGLLFAGSYATMQVGRAAFIVACLPRGHALAANYRRILGWMLIAATFWLAGGLAEHEHRLLLWALAVACEYVSPMLGFPLPGLGRSRTRDWTIEGGHLTERCQLFVIVALGETVLASGVALSEAEVWTPELLLALLTTFVSTLGLWWLYFGTSGKTATDVITHAEDPGRMGASFHYIHAILVGGVIVAAVGHDLVMAHPQSAPSAAQAAAVVAGPILFLLGCALYKRIVTRALPRSHLVGALALLGMALASGQMGLLTLGALVAAILLAVSLWERWVCAAALAPSQGASH
ncbi:low temperature requirement protein A [Ideonella dechloratans]|uniref:low temperature requirement protein A n=1 Tax=Ideonella dechloratans TaxID=36863 RepID=UPI0035AE1A94